MGWSPHINTSTQTLTNGVPDMGYEVMGQNFVYNNYVIHSLYTHFMYKKRAAPSGADASFDYWDLYITRKDYDNTWLTISNSSGGIIKYKSGAWSDHGTGSPNSISVSGTTVSLSQSGIWGTFTSPYPSGPTSGSGGTSTEGSSYSGTLTVNGTSLEYEIPATSSSGTYELKADDTTQLSIVHGSTASTGSAPNFDQTKIWTLISPMGDELDEIDLTGSGASSTKKVFCNFW
jgi:hypothetical protein